MRAATAKTIAAIVDPPGDSTVSATTSTGTSRMRISVSALGRFSGNIAEISRAARLPARLLRLGGRARRYSRPTVLPTGPSGDTVAASSGHGKMRRRAPWATSRQRMIQPKPWVQPRIVSTLSSKPPIATTSSAVKMHTSTAE